MNDYKLRRELDRLGKRYATVARSGAWGVIWLCAALGAVAVWMWVRGDQAAWLPAVAGAAGLLAMLPVFIRAKKRAGDRLWLARRIEAAYPDLDARLLAALEQEPGENPEDFGYLQKTVIDQAIDHGRRARWEQLVPARRIRLAYGLHFLSLAVCLLIVALVAIQLYPRFAAGGAGFAHKADEKFTIKVVPEDASIERGTALLVEARFGTARVPGDVSLLVKDGDGPAKEQEMSRSLDDPLFALRVPAVKRDLTYAVRYGSEQTRWYKVNVFEYPELKQADAKLKYPEYTGLAEQVVKDTRSITAVEGTKATLSFHLNKPVADAQLLPVARRPAEDATATAPASQPAAQPVQLTADKTDPTLYTASIDIKDSQTYALQLVDADKRSNRDQAQLAINVTRNRPPELKVTSPGRDLDVSALEEITVKANVWDDFGVKRVGLSYAIAGQDAKDVVLAENIPGKEHRDISQVISLEKLAAEPDQLLSYHLWTEDIGPDGKVRRTDGDIFFADVRPFEEIYRQGQALAGGQEEQQQRQQQQRQQGNQNAQRAENAANSLKQIIAATWNIMRRETAEKVSAQFVPDVKLLEDSLASTKEQAGNMQDRVTDERSQAYLASGLKHIDQATDKMKEGETAPSVAPLGGALAFEQDAYQDLLKLRAREFEVTRGNRQQGQQSASQQRQQRQINQMNMDQQDNPYQMRRNSLPQQEQAQESDQQRETRQVLSRLRDLAQRQEDLNRQMRDMQSALQQAQDQAQRDELQRQLARLREQQQQQLRDTDELQNRMNEPQNQQQMADASQQLQQTRNNIQQASQNLNNGQMQQASAAGQRASEQLNNLQNQVRRAAAGQFGEAMTQMRQDARSLEQNQQQIDQRLANLNQPQPDQQGQAGLRDNRQQQVAQQRQEIAQDLQQQRDKLQQLLDNMRQTTEQAETPEPVLSRQLYDTYRQAQQQQPDKALDNTQQLVRDGLLQEARQTNGDASRSITRVREGVEQAAGSVLGDETDALRRARAQLDSVAEALDREMGQAGVGTRPATQPANGAVARGTSTRPATRPGAPTIARGDTTRPATQPGAAQLAQNDARGGGNRPNGQTDQNGQPRQGRGNQARGGNQGQDQQIAQAGQPADQSERQGTGDRGQQPNQPGQNGQEASNQQGQNGQRGGNRGNQQAADGQQPGGNQDQQLAQGQRGAPGLRAGNPQAGQRGTRGGQRGQTDANQNADNQVADAQQQDQQPQDGQPGQPGQANARGGRGNQTADRTARQDRTGNLIPGGNDFAGTFNGPFTDDGFRNFSDNLRDVEEMLNDPRLQAQAAEIRRRAAQIRADASRHALPPNWNLVQETVSRPIAELRRAISEELLRRESQQAMVPLDKESVPPEYQDQVRRYYERLGSGK